MKRGHSLLARIVFTLVASFISLAFLGQSTAEAVGTRGAFSYVDSGGDIWDTAGSQDGRYVLAVGDFRVKISSNYGNTWTNLSIVSNQEFYTLQSADVSDDGKVMIIGGSHFVSQDVARAVTFLSSDFGATWTLSTESSALNYNVAVSGDGLNVYRGSSDTDTALSKSTFSSGSWSAWSDITNSPKKRWQDIVVNNNGQLIFDSRPEIERSTTVYLGQTQSIDTNKGVPYTRDGGSTWSYTNDFRYTTSGGSVVKVDPNHIWLAGDATTTSGVGFALSSFNGSTGNHALWKTTNSGANWTRVTGINSPSWPAGEALLDVTASNDGRRIEVAGIMYLYESNDSGVTWTRTDLSELGERNNNFFAPVFSAGNYVGNIVIYTQARVGNINAAATELGTANFTVPLPSGPQKVNAGGCSTSATLTWNAPSPGEGTISDYSIQYALASDSTWTTWSHSASTSLKATITGLTSGETYKFRVAGVSQYGTGAYTVSTNLVIGPSTLGHACLAKPNDYEQIPSSLNVSNDGSKILGGYSIAHYSDGSYSYPENGVFRSTDSGSTWTKPNTTYDFVDPVGSEDGACYLGGTNSYRSPVISKDSGSTWSTLASAGLPSGYGRGAGAAIGDDCTLASSTYALAYSQGVYLSTNGGASFTRKLTGDFAGLAMSRTTTNVGDRMVVGETLGKLQYTANRGATWTASTGTDLPNDKWGNIVMNQSGTKVAAVQTHFKSSGKVWLSNDGGASFTGVDPLGLGINQKWRIAAARDGSNKLVAASLNTSVVVLSSDWGATWNKYFYDVKATIYGVACNIDCSKIYITDSNGVELLVPTGGSMKVTRVAAGAASGAAFTTQPRVSFLDQFLLPVASDNSSVVTISEVSGATLNGTKTAIASAGVATFNSNLGITGSSKSLYTLAYSSPGYATVYQQIAVATGPAVRLESLSTYPSGSTIVNGSNIEYEQLLVLTDDYGNIVTSNSSSQVTMSISSGGTLSGETTTTLSGGLANFGTGISVSGTVGTTYTLTFSTPGKTSFTTDITPVLGSATKLVLTRASAGRASGNAFTTAPQVSVKDDAGNTVTSSSAVITASISAGGTLIGTKTATASSGVATFNSNLGVKGTAGTTYTITYSSGDFAIATENVTVTAGTPSAITLKRSAVGTASGVAFTTQPQIEFQDSAGNVSVNDSTSTVTATISAGGVLVGTASATAANGVATFPSNFGIGGTAGSSYTITFASGSFPSATQSITVIAGPAKKAYITRQAVGGAAGTVFGTQPIVTLKDAQGNITTADNSTVVTVTSSTGTTVGGTTTATVSSGVATFTDLFILGDSGTVTTLSFASPGITADTQTVTISTGPAYSIKSKIRPDGGVVGSQFTQQPQYLIVDRAGNIVTTNSSTVLTASISGCAGCVTGETATAVNGKVTFAHLAIIGGASGVREISVSATSPITYTYTDSINLGKGTPTFVGTKSFTVTYGTQGASISVPTPSTAGTWSFTSANTSILQVSNSNGTYSANGLGNTTVEATFTPTNTGGYNSATMTLTFVVEDGTPALTATSISKVFASGDFTLTAPTANVDGAFTYASNNTGVVTLNGMTVTIQSAGTTTITATFTPTDTARYVTTSVQIPVEITRATQAPLTIISTTGTYGSELSLITSGGTTGATVSYTKISGTCSISGTKVTSGNVGEACSIQGTMAGGSNYTDTTSPVTTITFSRATQRLTVLPISDRQNSSTKTIVSASSNYSGATIVITTSPSSVCTNVDETITVVASGTCEVKVNAAGSTNYTAAAEKTLTFDITGKSDVVLSGFTNLNGLVNSPATNIPLPGRTSGINVVDGTFAFVVDDTSIATINGSNQIVWGAQPGTTRIYGTFTPTDLTSYNVATGSFLITSQLNQQASIAFDSTTVVYGTNLLLAIHGGSSDGEVTYTLVSGADKCSLTGALLTPKGLGFCVVMAKKAGNASYGDITSNNTTINISPKPSVITVKSVNIKYGQSIPATSISVTGLVGSDTVTGVSGTTYTNYPTPAGPLSSPPTDPGQYYIDIAPPTYGVGSPDNYLITVNRGILTISKAEQNISFANPGTMAYNSESVTLVVTVDSPLPVTLTSSTTDVCTVSGFDLTMKTLGTCTLTASRAGTANYLAATSVTHSFVIQNATPGFGVFPSVEVTYPQSSVTLTAPTTTEAGTLTYSSSDPTIASFASASSRVATIHKAGTITVTATLTPTDTTRFASISTTTTLTVNKTVQDPLEFTYASINVGDTTTMTSTGGTGTGAKSYEVLSGDCSITGAVITGNSATSCSVKVTKAGDTNYLSASAIGTVNVSRKLQEINFPSITNRSFSTAPFTITAPTSTSGQTPTVTSLSTGVCTISGLSVSIVTRGLCSLQADAAQSATYAAATSVVQNFTISGKADVTLQSNKSIPSVIRLGDSPTALFAGTPSVPGTFTHDSLSTAVATISGDSITAVAVGTTVVKTTFTPTNSTNYNSLVLLNTVTVDKAIQPAINLTMSRMTIAPYETSTATVTGGGGTGLLAIVITSGPCTFFDSMTITAFDYGVCSLRAEIQGDSRYEPANSATVTISIPDPDAVVVTPPAPSGGGGFGGGFVASSIDKVEALTYSISGTTVTLKWSGNTSAVKIVITATDRSTRTLEVAKDLFEAQISGLVPGYAYAITVTPTGIVDATSAKNVAISLTPRQPSEVKVEALSQASLKVVWSKDPGTSQVKVLLTAPNEAPITATSDGTSVTLAAKPGVVYELKLVAVGAAELSSDPFILNGAFIPVSVVKPAPDTSTATSATKLVPVTRVSTFYGNNVFVLTPKEAAALASIKKYVTKGRTLTCTAYTSSSAPSATLKAMVLKQAKAACTSALGKTKGVTVVTSTVPVSKAPKATRRPGLTRLIYRVDLTVSKTVTASATATA